MADLDRDRLHRDLMAIGTAILDRVPTKVHIGLRLQGIDLTSSIRAICDQLTALPDDDLARVLSVIRWETNAALEPEPPKVAWPMDAPHRSSLAKVIDLLTKIA